MRQPYCRGHCGPLSSTRLVVCELGKKNGKRIKGQAADVARGGIWAPTFPCEGNKYQHMYGVTDGQHTRDMPRNHTRCKRQAEPLHAAIPKACSTLTPHQESMPQACLRAVGKLKLGRGEWGWWSSSGALFIIRHCRAQLGENLSSPPAPTSPHATGLPAHQRTPSGLLGVLCGGLRPDVDVQEGLRDDCRLDRVQ